MFTMFIIWPSDENSQS